MLKDMRKSASRSSKDASVLHALLLARLPFLFVLFSTPSSLPQAQLFMLLCFFLGPSFFPFLVVCPRYLCSVMRFPILVQTLPR